MSLQRPVFACAAHSATGCLYPARPAGSFAMSHINSNCRLRCPCPCTSSLGWESIRACPALAVAMALKGCCLLRQLAKTVACHVQKRHWAASADAQGRQLLSFGSGIHVRIRVAYCLRFLCNCCPDVVACITLSSGCPSTALKMR